jgi:hypothetical protein
MRDLHEELTALSVEWPATPDVAGAVAARLAAGDAVARPRPRRAWRPVLAYGLAALAAGFAIVMAVSPDARSAVLEWLGLKSVKIERREPTAPPPRPGKLGAGLGLGTPATLAEARRRYPFLRLPQADRLGRPDTVYLGRLGVALVYGKRPGYARSTTTGAAVLVQELPARVEPFIEKTVGAGTRLERLRLPGRGRDPLRGPAPGRQHAAGRARRWAAGPRRGGPHARPRRRDRAIDPEDVNAGRLRDRAA